jgi:hypothetical protein
MKFNNIDTSDYNKFVVSINDKDKILKKTELFSLLKKKNYKLIINYINTNNDDLINHAYNNN